MHMGNRNRKATKVEMEHVRWVIREAFPGLEPIFGGRGGSVAPRVRTIQFRLRDAKGKYRSNMIWLMPDELLTLTPDDIRRRVESSNR
jgi:hypothetical protein